MNTQGKISGIHITRDRRGTAWRAHMKKKKYVRCLHGIKYSIIRKKKEKKKVGKMNLRWLSLSCLVTF